MPIVNKNGLTHVQHSAKVRPTCPCGPHHTAFGGGCYNCGFEPAKPNKVKENNATRSALDLIKEYRNIIEAKDDKELSYKEKVAKGKLCADCGSCRPVKGGNGYCKKCAGMNESKIQGASDPNRIVKCGCGLPMRANKWSDHWISCKVARGVPVTQQDKEDLEAYEARLSESIVDKSPIASFLTRNGFENDTAGSDEMVSTFTNEAASLKIHIYSDDKYWTIEDINQPDEILEDGSGVNELSRMVAHLLNMASGTPEPTNTVQSGKFNTCSNCDGKGCASCDYTGEYAVGMNKHHYD